jgi:hypothetical protein
MRPDTLGFDYAVQALTRLFLVANRIASGPRQDR